MIVTKRFFACLLAVAFCAAASAGPVPSQHKSTTLTKSVAKPAPAFTLTDVEGTKRTLADYRGRSVGLFFFCGCPWCTRCARDWAQFQRGGALPEGSVPSPGTAAMGQGPVTLVVFSGDGAAARNFALSTGLDPARTVLLPDTQMHVTLDLYNAEPCPRVFVLDPQGRVRYTNDHRDDAPRQAPEMVIASRALDALRACSSPPSVTDQNGRRLQP